MPETSKTPVFASECDLCAAAVPFFRAQGLDVHEEVILRYLPKPPRIDIVLVRAGDPPVLSAVHAKLELTDGLITQVRAVLPYATRSWALIGRKSLTGAFVLRVRRLRDLGIGLVVAHPDVPGELEPLLWPKLNKTAATHHLEDALGVEIKAPRPAGSPGGSPSAVSLERFRPLWAWVYNNPGSRPTHAWGAVGRELRFLGRRRGAWVGELLRRLDAGEVPNVRTEDQGGQTVLLPALPELEEAAE